MSSSNWNIGQWGAVAIGVAYVAAGLIGFAVTGFGSFIQDTGYDILGFDVNPFHNVFHLTVGAYLLLVARLSPTATEGALIGGGLVYLVAAGLGFDGRLQILSINDAFAQDQFLHIASGSAALLLGLVSTLLSRSKRSGDVVQHT